MILKGYMKIVCKDAYHKKVLSQDSLWRHREYKSKKQVFFPDGRVSPSLRLWLSQGQYKKAIASLHHLAALQGSLPQPQISGQGTLEHQRALIQLATCHFALGEYRVSPGCPVGVGTPLGALSDPGASFPSQSSFLIPCIFTWNLLFLPRFYYLICWWKSLVILFYLISYFPSRT